VGGAEIIVERVVDADSIVAEIAADSIVAEIAADSIEVVASGMDITTAVEVEAVLIGGEVADLIDGDGVDLAAAVEASIAVEDGVEDSTEVVVEVLIANALLAGMAILGSACTNWFQRLAAVGKLYSCSVHFVKNMTHAHS